MVKKKPKKKAEDLEVEPDPNELTLAVLQCVLNEARELNMARVLGLIRDAAEQGANVIVAPALFEGPYFCRARDDSYFEWARPIDQCPALERVRRLAAELEVVLPFSFFERAGQAFYLSVAVIDADGSLLGTYRAAHLADRPGCAEKYYFRPGNSGFRVWSTQHGKIGVAACSDLWFPECARAMALLGAEALLYPVAQRGVPGETGELGWRRALLGHAAANAVPIAVANRVGEEGGEAFSGRSFVAGAEGQILAELGSAQGGIAHHTFDRARLDTARAASGLFRDRRPELYAPLLRGDDGG